MRGIALLLTACILSAGWSASTAIAAPTKGTSTNTVKKDMKIVFQDRRALFDKFSTLTGIPWYYLAAVDQYERTISIAKKRPMRDGLVGIYYSELDWVGLTNPDHEDTELVSIAFHNGKGRDGSGDGKADYKNDSDVLYAMASYLKRKGTSEDDLRIALWEYYDSARAVERIDQFAHIYKSFDRLDLHDHAFPLPLKADYSYRSTWGASRGWGGYRIHEGTDLFAHYGVPVRSTCYGIIEVMGWNPYGGWRVGIRDLNNVYHYYAHLQGFNKEVKKGDLVKPGQVVGWVGSSGYGKPGTSGKFPPHLHYGLYRDNGSTEWSFDPYPYLRKWEREEATRSKKKS